MAAAEGARPFPFRLLLRVAAVLCLLLAALLLSADAGEYPGLSRAGLRALARGALPLLLVAALNLRLLAPTRPRRGWRWAALGGNLLLLGAALRALVPGGAPPFFWMLAVVALLLTIGVAGTWRAPGPRAGARPT